MPGGFPLGLELCNGTDQGTDTANSRGTLMAIGNHTYGAYTQIVASTPNDTSWMQVNIWTDGNSNTGNQQSVIIAVGAAASEVVIAYDLFIFAPTSTVCLQSYVFPVSIPAGTRIAAKAAGKATTDKVYVSVILFDAAFQQMEGCAGVDSIGYSSTVNGVSVTPGAANTKGSYAQIVASTTKDYIGLMMGIGGTTDIVSTAISPSLFDIAIGGAGSEQIIVPNIPYNRVQDMGLKACGPYFVPVPAGTRLAVRSQNVAGATASGIILYGIYQ